MLAAAVPKADEEIGRRIKALRESLGLSTRQFAKGVPGLRSSNLSEIERGIRRVTAPMLAAFEQKYGISASELLVGVKEKGPVSFHNIKGVPVFSAVEAAHILWGGGERVSLPSCKMVAPAKTNDPKAFFIQAHGRGLSGGRIAEGDLILVEPTRKVEHGDAAIFCRTCPEDPKDCVPELVKVTKDESGLWTLVPKNGNEGPVICTLTELKGLKIFKVSAVLRTL